MKTRTKIAWVIVDWFHGPEYPAICDHGSPDWLGLECVVTRLLWPFIPAFAWVVYGWLAGIDDQVWGYTLCLILIALYLPYWLVVIWAGWETRPRRRG